MEITQEAFWGIIAVVLCSSWAISKHYAKKAERSGRNRTYHLYIRLTDKALEHPLIKETSKSQGKIADEQLANNCAADFIFLGSDGLWCRDRRYILPPTTTFPSTLCYNQIAGRITDDDYNRSTPATFFIITEQVESGIGRFLSLDLHYTSSSPMKKDFEEKKIHLGNLPIPPIYGEWDNNAFKRLSANGWKETKNNCEYENKDGTVILELF